MHITPKRRYRATLIPKEVPAHEAELRASQGALPFVQLLAANSGVAGKLAHHVTGLPVLSVDRFELSIPFRVTADWPGGGFAHTIEAESHAAALAWGREKAKAHPDAVITAEPRVKVSQAHGLLTRPVQMHTRGAA